MGVEDNFSARTPRSQWFGHHSRNLFKNVSKLALVLLIISWPFWLEAAEDSPKDALASAIAAVEGKPESAAQEDTPWFPELEEQPQRIIPEWFQPNVPCSEPDCSERFCSADELTDHLGGVHQKFHCEACGQVFRLSQRTGHTKLEVTKQLKRAKTAVTVARESRGGRHHLNGIPWSNILSTQWRNPNRNKKSYKIQDPSGRKSLFRAKFQRTNFLHKKRNGQ